MRSRAKSRPEPKHAGEPYPSSPSPYSFGERLAREALENLRTALLFVTATIGGVILAFTDQVDAGAAQRFLVLAYSLTIAASGVALLGADPFTVRRNTALRWFRWSARPLVFGLVIYSCWLGTR